MYYRANTLILPIYHSVSCPKSKEKKENKIFCFTNILTLTKFQQILLLFPFLSFKTQEETKEAESVGGSTLSDK